MKRRNYYLSCNWITNLQHFHCHVHPEGKANFSFSHQMRFVILVSPGLVAYPTCEPWARPLFSSTGRVQIASRRPACHHPSLLPGPAQTPIQRSYPLTFPPWPFFHDSTSPWPDTSVQGHFEDMDWKALTQVLDFKRWIWIKFVLDNVNNDTFFKNKDFMHLTEVMLN